MVMKRNVFLAFALALVLLTAVLAIAAPGDYWVGGNGDIHGYSLGIVNSMSLRGGSVDFTGSTVYNGTFEGGTFSNISGTYAHLDVTNSANFTGSNIYNGTFEGGVLGAQAKPMTDIITKGPWVDVRAYGSINNAVAAGIVNATLVVTKAPGASKTVYPLTGSVTIPASDTLVVENGAAISNGTSHNILNIDGPFSAGLYQVFSGFGTQDVHLEPGSVSMALPAWWGADASGTLDSSTAIQSAIYSIGNGEVFFPAGNYKTVNPVYVTSGEAVSMVGAGKGETIISPSGNFNAIIFEGGGSGGGVFNLQFNGSGMTGGAFISIFSYNRATIKNILINGGYNGIYVQDQNVCSVDDVWIYGLTGQYAIKNYGSSVGSANVFDLNNVEIGFTTNTSTSPVGILLDGNAATVDIRHVGVTKGSYGLEMTNSGNLTNGPEFVTAYDFQSDYAYNDGIASISGTGYNEVLQFSDIYCQGAVTGNGVYLDAHTYDTTISGGFISNNYQSGVWDIGRYTKLIGLQISDNSIQGSAAYPGVEVGGTAYGIYIEGCLIGQFVGYASENQSYGIVLNTGCNKIIITGNDLTGNVTGEMNDGSGSVTKTLTNNL